MIDRKSSVPVPTPNMKKKTGNGGSYTRTPVRAGLQSQLI